MPAVSAPRLDEVLAPFAITGEPLARLARLHELDDDHVDTLSGSLLETFRALDTGPRSAESVSHMAEVAEAIDVVRDVRATRADLTARVYGSDDPGAQGLAPLAAAASRVRAVLHRYPPGCGPGPRVFRWFARR